MNKKISLGVAISLIAIGCAITFVLTWTISLNIYNSKISSAQKYDGAYDKIRQMDAVIRSNYIGEIDEEAVKNGILSGYVNSIGDGNATYLTPTEYYRKQQIESGVVTGAGFEAYEDGSGYLVISSVYKNSSADNNGLMPGDVITEIDGRSVTQMEPGAALDKISGEIGTQITIGYLRISAFNQNTAEQFSRSLNTVLSNKATALVIDIRQNKGEVFSVVKPMLNRILPAAVAANAEYKNNVIKPLIETDSERQLDIPIAVLLDSGTSSAAELFAIALKDEGKATLIGTRTSGKATVVTTYEFPDGAALSISTAKVVPSKSASYDKTGINPDYVVELPAGMYVDYVEHDADTQLIKALEILGSGTTN